MGTYKGLANYKPNPSSSISFLHSNAGDPLATTLTYMPVSGSIGENTTELNRHLYFPRAFSWSNLSCYVSGFDNSPDPTIKSRVGGVTKNQVLTLTADGAFEDVSNTDVVPANSLINWIYGGESSSGNCTGRYSCVVTI